MIPGGYYIKARCIQDSWVSTAQPIIREVWDYLLREANHEDKKYAGFVVKRGQLFRSYREIRDGLSWKIGFRIERYHESSMKRAMKALMNERMIELTSEPRGNIITICNYEFYQDPKNYERTNERTNCEPMNEPIANQQRSAINKNVKNKKKEEYNNTSCPEPEKSGPVPEQISEPESPPFLEIPLIKKDGVFVVSENHVSEWEDAYPGINVRQELRNLQQWNKANQERRKTRTGILKHIVSWLSKAQNSAVPKINGKNFARPNRTEKNMIECQNFIQGAPDAR